MDADLSDRPQETDIKQIRESLASLMREFRVLIAVLLTDLAYQGDTEMRFLGIRLNYNEVFTVKSGFLFSWLIYVPCRSINLFGGQAAEMDGSGENGKVDIRVPGEIKIRELERKARLQLCKISLPEI